MLFVKRIKNNILILTCTGLIFTMLSSFYFIAPDTTNSDLNRTGIDCTGANA